MKINPDIQIQQNQLNLESKKAHSLEPADKEAMREIQLLKKSKELESVFLTQLIKSMEKTIPEGMDGSKNSLSSMMFSSVMGEAMADGGGIGLSKMIYASLKDRVDDAEMPDFSAEDYLETMNLLQGIGLTEDLK